MRLTIDEIFGTSISCLPQNVQLNFWDFTRKFSINPYSKGINLEKLRTGKNLYSARINDKYRVIVGSPRGDEGDEFVLLYAGNHEDAYRWAENRSYEWNERTHEIQNFIFQELAPLSEVPESSLFGGIDQDKLLRLGVPEILVPIVRRINEDDFEQYEDKLPQYVYQRLKDIYDGSSLDEVIKEVEAGKAKKGEDPFLSANNWGVIEVNDELLAEIMKEGIENWQLFLYPTQKKLVIDNYKGSVKVSGSAGTGKTIAALHRLKHLAEQPNANVLFTTFTKALKNNLIGMAERMKVPAERYTIDNIDKVLNDIRNDFTDIPSCDILEYKTPDMSEELWGEVLSRHKDSEFTEDFLHREYVDIILYFNNRDLESYLKQSRIGGEKSLTKKQRIEIWKLKEEYDALKRKNKCLNKFELYNLVTNYLVDNNIHPFTNVIVDEFQDLSNPQLRFLRSLVAVGPNDMFIVGDPLQRLYDGRGANFSAAGINVRGKRSRKLKINYRTTEEIKKTAVSVVKECKYDDMDGGEEDNKGYISFTHGERPSYNMFESRDEETAQVLKYIDFCMEKGIELKEICIASKTKNYANDIQAALRKKKPEYKYCRVVDGEKDGDKDGLSFCTIHSLKGLEYDAVIITDVNEARFPSNVPDEEENRRVIGRGTTKNQKNRSLLYVAITRARQAAFITGVGEPTKLIELTE